MEKDLVLTESIIRNSGVKFLRNYYKSRRKVNAKPTTIKTDVQTEGGLVADAYFEIPQEDGSQFIVTLEATSFHKSKEIFYQKRILKLNWDSFTVTSLFTTIAIASLYYFYLRPVDQFGPWLFFTGLLVSVILLYVVIRSIARNYKRYRYIFAIEQFKQYFANEHWIAFGEDVFIDEKDESKGKILRRYKEELKRQCIKSGVGLLSVDKELKVHPIVTPSREIVLKQKKRRLGFLTRQELAKQSKGKNRWLTVPRWLRYRRMQQTINYKRFQQQPYKQFLFIVFSWLVTGALIYAELTDPKIVYEEEERYEEALMDSITDLYPETEEYTFDTVFMNPFHKTTTFYLIGPGKTFRQLRNQGWIKRPIRRKDKNVYFSKGENELVWYECEKFSVFKETQYYLAYQRTETITKAFQVAENLRKEGIPANIFWEGCFDLGSNYRIFIDVFFDTREEAQFRKEQIQKILKTKDNMAKFIAVNSILFDG